MTDVQQVPDKMDLLPIWKVAELPPFGGNVRTLTSALRRKGLPIVEFSRTNRWVRRSVLDALLQNSERVPQ